MYKFILIILCLLCIINISFGANPIAEYRFSETGPYGDNLDNIFDYTLNGHKGVAHGNVSYISGIFGRGLNFENQYSYVSVPDHIDFTFSNGITDYDYSLSFWCKSDLYENVVFFSKGHFTSDHEYSCYVGLNSRIMFYMKDNNFAHGAFKYGLTRKDLKPYTNEWINIVVTHGPSNKINIFVNGEYWETDEGLGENYTAMQNGINNITMGQVNSFSNPVFLDEIVIWDSYLTFDDVKDLYLSFRDEYYTLTLISKDLFNSKNNFSLYEDGKYIGTYSYKDTFNITDMRTYTIIIHENINDQIAHIENLDDVGLNNITYLIYILLFVGVIALIKYYYRRF